MHTRRRRPLGWLLLAAGFCGPGAAAAEAVPAEQLVFGGYADIRSSAVRRKVAPLQPSLERSAVAKGLPGQVQAFERHP